MDPPLELLGDQTILPGSGCGRGISIFQPNRPAPSEPLFRVKRWRREPAESYVDPSPKASATSYKSVLNRWDGQGLGAHYKPYSNGPLHMGGLQPPPLRHRREVEWDAHPPGLQYVPPSTLSVHARSYQCQLNHDRPVSAGSASIVQMQPNSVSTFLSGILDVPSNVVKASIADSTTMHALHQQLKTQHHMDWLQLLKQAGSNSELIKSTQDSPNQEAHLIKVVAKFAPSTLAAYFKGWSQWVEFCHCHQVCPYSPPTVFLADFLQVSSKRSSLGVATAQSRALTWVSKYAGFPALLGALQAPITRAYTIPSEISVRKEAAPLPLSFVVYLESCILKELGTAADRLVMGSLLVLIWSSLRWSDALWVTPSALTEDVDVIRGIAVRTKTTSRGMPFAFVKSGLLATSSQVTWSMKWLNLVRQALQRTAEVFPDFTPDFLLPMCGPNVDNPMFTAPMPRTQGVLLLRRLLLQANKDVSVLSIGVHSPKVTLLSWARQIGASEEARMAQGHRRQSGARSNVALYGRDDVHPAIQLQYQIIQRIASGFRPVIPLLRGGAKPVLDKPVSVAPPSEEITPQAQTQLCLPHSEDLVDTDSGESDAGAAPEVQDDMEVPVIHAASADCLFLLNATSSIAHVAAVCDESDPYRVVTVDAGEVRKSFKFACNVRRAAWDAEIIPAETFPEKI